MNDRLKRLFIDPKPTLFAKEKAIRIAEKCNADDKDWEYLVAPSTTVDKYCVAVIDEEGEHVGFF